MTAAFHFETGTASHVGKVRRVNEDALFAAPDRGVWLVADGMGGHDDGQLASTTIVEEASAIGRPESVSDLVSQFRDRMLRANARLIEAAARKGPGVIIGSTVAASLLHGSRYACAWCGDSRVYLVRNHRIVQVSRDHSEVQDLVDSGAITAAEARVWPRRNIITRAIGIGGDPGLEVVKGEVEPNDVFVVCSDGLTDPVDDSEILRSTEAHGPDAACALIDLALERGAKDNVTVVVVRCLGGEAKA